MRLKGPQGVWDSGLGAVDWGFGSNRVGVYSDLRPRAFPEPFS